jgi:hypothetical protein
MASKKGTNIMILIPAAASMVLPGTKADLAQQITRLNAGFMKIGIGGTQKESPVKSNPNKALFRNTMN